MKTKVLLGMSGGIDSSVSAMLLQDEGYEVVGITFLFGDSEKANRQISSDAKNLAENLGIKHITVNLQKEFRNSVIEYFKMEYISGRTPFPCAYCNPNIKFHYLQIYAHKEKCDFIATGHYVQTKLYKDKKYVFSGIDPEKDQSFFLWGLKPKLIEKLLFPLGGYKKNEIRKIAKVRGFILLSKKKDSLGICFIEGSNYRKFLKKEGIISKPGNFIDKNGKILGRHDGISNYTIGQRRGLGIHLNFPVFVSEFRLDDNQIVLSEYSDLYKQKIIIRDYNILDNQVYKGNYKLSLRVRYRLQETPCELHILNESRAEARLLKPEAMIAPGQTAVFYDGDRLVGGGFIESAK